MPELCPFCGNPIVLPEGEAKAKCTGGFTCPSRLREYLYHFGSRGAMDIEGLGYKTVDTLVTLGLITDPADIYTLTVDDLLPIEGWKEVSANKLVAAIERSKSQPLAKLIFGLGIDHVGGTVAGMLADRFGSLDDLLSASIEEIEEIDGIGPEIAGSVVEWGTDPDNRDLVERIAASGVSTRDEAGDEPEKPQLFEGLTFVVTGTMERFTRDDAKTAITARGGKVTGSVSGRTDALIAGAKAGSKLAKAESLGVSVLDEDAFEVALEQGLELGTRNVR
jgi:DNA ligase (NAD+)